MQYVDYYKTLGVDRGATQEQISRAFKTLARKCHPDLNKGSGAEAKFKQVSEAYEVLKDPKTRERYDTLGANHKHGAPFEPPPQWGNGGGVRFEFRNGSPGTAGDFSDFFSSFMGGNGGGFGRRNGRGISIEDLFGDPDLGFGGARPPERGQDIQSELTVELEDVFHGRTRSIQLSGPEGNKTYDVKIPRGVRSGERIRLAGQGASGADGARGDLYLTIKLAAHPTFRVEGDDLVVQTTVEPWDAALGTKKTIRTPGGLVTMTLPPGVSSGQRLRLKDKGLPRRSGGAGDLFAEIKIVVPQKLTREQRSLFEQLKRASPQPRA